MKLHWPFEKPVSRRQTTIRTREYSTFLFLFLIALSASLGTASSSKERISLLAQESLKKEDVGDLRAAIKLSKQILKLDPSNPIHFIRIGGLNGKLGNFEEEIRWIDKALKINPMLLDAHINRGSALAGLGRKEEAKKSFLKAIEIDPNNANAYYSLGVLEEQFEHNYQQALTFYLKSTELNPQCEDCHFNAAASAAQLGRFDLASKEAEKALRLNPNSQEIKHLLERILRALKPR